MKNLYIACIMVCLSYPCFSQKHEVGASGGYVYGNASRDKLSWTDKGFTLGGYYQYAPYKFVGVMADMHYMHTSKEDGWNIKKMPQDFGLTSFSLLLFPRYRVSLIGSYFLEYCFNDIYAGKEGNYRKMTKKLGTGFGGGFRVNFKPVKIRIEFKKSSTAWADDSDFGNLLHPVNFKTTIFRGTVDVPLWRSKPKQR